MKQTFQNIIAVLNKKEKQKFNLLILLNTIISVVDIASLALLVYIVHFYTSGSASLNISFIPSEFLQRNSMLLFGMVLLLFIIKNFAAYAVSIFQYKFVYSVASRTAHLNLLKYLNGDYLDYVNKDPSVHIRKMSQEPVEFSHHL